MNIQKFLKHIHVCGTLWFLLCAAVLLIFSLRHAGVGWWVIFSISGLSAVMLFLLFVTYLFAVYQGVVRSQNPVEHPLTTSSSYILLYDIAPFLGLISGLLALPSLSWSLVLSSVAQGTLAITVLMWIIIDPVVGLVESAMPQSIAARRQRIQRHRRLKLQNRRENEQLLATLEQQENTLKAQWADTFAPFAAEAAKLLCEDLEQSDRTQRRLVELGAMAWQQGRLICMQELHEMILREIRSRPDPPDVDFAALWWDGIGLWRRPEISNLILEPLRPAPESKLLLQQS